jgi:hypothetical protein
LGVSDRTSLDDATEIVGRAKFGDAWVGLAPDEEFKLAKEYRRRLRDGLPISEALECAAEREARADRQRREVNHWLEDRGFNIMRGRKEGFDRSHGGVSQWRCSIGLTPSAVGFVCVPPPFDPATPPAAGKNPSRARPRN